MTGFEVFSLYNALKLHFTTDKYDYFKYNGKTQVSVESFDRRKDKYFFHKLSRKFNNKDDLVFFLVSNFLEKDKLWAGDLLSEEAMSNHAKHQKVMQSLSYVFQEDCIKLFQSEKNPNVILQTTGDYPILLKKALQQDIHFESFCLLSQILGFLPKWNQTITDTIRWPDFYRKVNKFSCFLPVDVLKYKLILKKVIA